MCERKSARASHGARPRYINFHISGIVTTRLQHHNTTFSLANRGQGKCLAATGICPAPQTGGRQDGLFFLTEAFASPVRRCSPPVALSFLVSQCRSFFFSFVFGFFGGTKLRHQKADGTGAVRERAGCCWRAWNVCLAGWQHAWGPCSAPARSPIVSRHLTFLRGVATSARL